MNLITKYMTRNDCYYTGRTITPAGIMIHSTATPGVMAEEWYGLWNKSYRLGEMSRQVCVHAFLDNTVVLQTLPWDMRAWHAGGSANNTHIGIEICEPPGFTYVKHVMTGYDPVAQAPYFRAVWRTAVALCVYLCGIFNLTDKNIITHDEGYVLGIASNHADVSHWFPKHNESMDTFRAAVKIALTKWEEEEKMTQDAFNKLMTAWQEQHDPLYKTLEDVPPYWKDDATALVAAGAIKGDGVYSFGVRRNILKAAIAGKRYADSLK